MLKSCIRLGLNVRARQNIMSGHLQAQRVILMLKKVQAWKTRSDARFKKFADQKNKNSGDIKQDNQD